MADQQPGKKDGLGVPQYQHIETVLLDELRDGIYLPGQRFLTERDVCDRFGVSRTTAVRALNDLVREGRITRVQGSGTFVAEAAASPVSASPRGERRLIGLICQHLEDMHSMAIIRGVATACRELDYHFLLFESAGAARLEAESIQRARDGGAAGLVVYPVDGYDNALRFEGLQREGVPFVMIDRYYPSILSDVVLPDHVSLAEGAVSNLIGQGYRRIAMIGATETFATSSNDRAVGYRLALSTHGIPYEPGLAITRPYLALGAEARRALLSGWLALPDPPTAYLAMTAATLPLLANDLIDLGVDLQSVALAAMDDLVSDTVLNLAVVTGHLPSYEMGYEAVRLLVERIESTDVPKPRHLVLPVTITASPRAFRLEKVAGQ